jgi:ornithine decarboxylase
VTDPDVLSSEQEEELSDERREARHSFTAIRRDPGQEAPPNRMPESGRVYSGFHRKVSYDHEGYPVAEGDDGIFIYHEGTDLESVARDVLPKYPDLSFCFLNIGALRERVRVIQQKFLPGHPGSTIAYAVKANSRRKILEVLSEAGINSFDCASTAEICLMKSVCPDGEILFNNPVKSPSAVKYAGSMGVRHFTVQTASEVRKVFENFPLNLRDQPAEMVVRMLTPNRNAKIDFSSKYGATSNEVDEIIAAIRGQHGWVPGISVHVGSQNTAVNKFVTAIQGMAQMSRKHGGFRTMNVGGGIPVNYEDDTRFDIVEYLEIISKAITDYALDTMDQDHRIIIELGRAIVAESVDLVIPITYMGRRNETNCIYFNDGVYTSFIDALIHGWRYCIKALSSLGTPKDSTRTKRYQMFGRTCDSGDTLGEVELPADLHEGDYIWVPKAGAYMDSQTSRFNGFPPPLYVAYNTD